MAPPVMQRKIKRHLGGQKVIPRSKISPMSTRDECQDSVGLILGGTELAVKNQGHHGHHQSNSMVVDIHHGLT